MQAECMHAGPLSRIRGHWRASSAQNVPMRIFAKQLQVASIIHVGFL